MSKIGNIHFSNQNNPQTTTNRKNIVYSYFNSSIHRYMLERIHIQNFRSLKDVSLDLQPINLLIGANNSGKSNLLKGLLFIAMCKHITGLSFDKRVIFQESNEDMLFNLQFSDNDEFIYTYQQEISSSKTNGNSSIFFGQSAEKIYDRFIIRNEKFLENNFDIYSPNIPLESLKADYRKEASELVNKISIFIDNVFNDIKIYQPDSAKLTKPYPLIPSTNINSDASNLVAFFDNIIGKHPKIRENIETNLSACIDEFIGIRLDTVDLTEEKRAEYGEHKGKTFKKLGLEDKHGKIYWADELSEGTLYFLALLAIIHQPNPPKLLLLEEPERGIHPRRIDEVINLIFKLAREKEIQVIMTTHSPLVLDKFKDMPEAVFVFDKNDEGATEVRNLEKDIIIPKEEALEKEGIHPIDYTRSMGSNWLMGFFGGVPHNIFSK